MRIKIMTYIIYNPFWYLSGSYIWSSIHCKAWEKPNQTILHATDSDYVRKKVLKASYGKHSAYYILKNSSSLWLCNFYSINFFLIQKKKLYYFAILKKYFLIIFLVSKNLSNSYILQHFFCEIQFFVFMIPSDDCFFSVLLPFTNFFRLKILGWHDRHLCTLEIYKIIILHTST